MMEPMANEECDFVEETRAGKLEKLLVSIKAAMIADMSDQMGCDWSHMIKAIDEAVSKEPA